VSDDEILASLRESLLRGESAGIPSPIVRLSDEDLKLVVGGFGSLDSSPSRTTLGGVSSCDGTCTCCGAGCDDSAYGAT